MQRRQLTKKRSGCVFPSISRYSGPVQFPPTPQQQAIVDLPVRKGEIMLLNAYAGTGKTTTLEMYARAHSDVRFLYFSFNRDTAREAAGRFPANCRCRTTHSLAYSAVGATYRPIGQIRPRDVMEAFGIGRPYVAVYIIDTLNAFLHSTDRKLEKFHLALPPTTKSEVKGQVLAVAKKLWTAMCDRNRREIPMTHDGYLKLWAM